MTSALAWLNSRQVRPGPIADRRVFSLHPLLLCFRLPHGRRMHTGIEPLMYPMASLEVLSDFLSGLRSFLHTGAKPAKCEKIQCDRLTADLTLSLCRVVDCLAQSDHCRSVHPPNMAAFPKGPAAPLVSRRRARAAILSSRVNTVAVGSAARATCPASSPAAPEDSAGAPDWFASASPRILARRRPLGLRARRLLNLFQITRGYVISTVLPNQKWPCAEPALKAFGGFLAHGRATKLQVNWRNLSPR